MKLTNVRAFEKHLQEAGPAHFSPVYLLISADDYERRQLADKLTAAVLDGLPLDSHHVKKLDRAHHSVQSLMHELGSLNFFSKKRVVIYTQASELKKEEAMQLESYYARPDPAICLVFLSSGINRSLRFYKQIEKEGVILDIEPEKPWEKEASLCESASLWFKNEGKKTAPGVVQALVKSINNDQAQLLQEMEKLLCYIAERSELTLDDLKAIGAGKISYTAWQLGDAIFSRRCHEALQVANQLLDEAEPLIALLRALRVQFQTRFLGATAPPEEVQRRFPYLRGQMLNKLIQQARQYGAQSCRRGLLLVDEAELQAKNSSRSPQNILETLIMQLAAI